MKVRVKEDLYYCERAGVVNRDEIEGSRLEIEANFDKNGNIIPYCRKGVTGEWDEDEQAIFNSSDGGEHYIQFERCEVIGS